jgi:K+-transporting ATPase ATPase C chain
MKSLQNADPENGNPIPVDLVTASASGLDPHISIAAALYQVPRVARLRGIPQDKVVEIVGQNTQGRLLGVIGEPVVNVLQLNLALDKSER